MNFPARPALLFPGQGSEAIGMSNGWEANPAWAATLEQAESFSGLPLRTWMSEGPEAALRAPRNAPLAGIAHSVGVYRAHRAAGMPLPLFAAGHSLGFYSALVAAGVVPLEAAMDLVNAVEDLCVPRFGDRTGMAFFIGLTELELRTALVGRPNLALSNINGKAQFTVSGSRPELEALVAELAPQCLKAGLLPVRHPLHAPHMMPLVPEVARRLVRWTVGTMAFPVLSHVDGQPLRDAGQAWDEAIASIGLPVHWLEVVKGFGQEPVQLYECGCGNQLTNLTRWADRDRTVLSLQSAPQADRWT